MKFLCFSFLIFATSCSTANNDSIEQVPINNTSERGMDVVTNSSRPHEDFADQNDTVIIAGYVKVKDERDEVPEKLDFLLLNSNNKEISRISTSKGNKFLFKGSFPKGKYEIWCISSNFHGKAQVDLDTYIIEEVVIYLEPINGL